MSNDEIRNKVIDYRVKNEILEESLQKLTPEALKVIDLLLEGKSVIEISKELGVSRQAVYKLMNNEGFKFAFAKVKRALLKEATVKFRLIIQKSLEVVLGELSKENSTEKLKTALKVLESIKFGIEDLQTEDREDEHIEDKSIHSWTLDDEFKKNRSLSSMLTSLQNEIKELAKQAKQAKKEDKMTVKEALNIYDKG